MANYKEKSEMELQDMLVELNESNETLETLLPDDDIQAEIDANNKNIADINATIKGETVEEEVEESMPLPAISTTLPEADESPIEEVEEITQRTRHNIRESGLSVEELKTNIDPDLLFKSGGVIKGYPKKTTVRKFFNWYGGRNWKDDEQLTNEMFVNDTHAQDNEYLGKNWLKHLHEKQYAPITLNIKENLNLRGNLQGYEYIFKLGKDIYTIDAIDVYAKGGETAEISNYGDLKKEINKLDKKQLKYQVGVENEDTKEYNPIEKISDLKHGPTLEYAKGGSIKNISFVKPNDITSEEIYSFGNKNKLILYSDDKRIGDFYFNMKGYLPNFYLSNNNNVGYHFSEKGEKTQLREFKKALRDGFTNIKSYAKGGKIEFRKLAKSKNFDIIVEEGRFEIELDKDGSGKYIVDSKGNRKDINKNPIALKYQKQIQKHIGDIFFDRDDIEYAKGGVLKDYKVGTTTTFYDSMKEIIEEGEYFITENKYQDGELAVNVKLYNIAYSKEQALEKIEKEKGKFTDKEKEEIEDIISDEWAEEVFNFLRDDASHQTATYLAEEYGLNEDNIGQTGRSGGWYVFSDGKDLESYIEELKTILNNNYTDKGEYVGDGHWNYDYEKITFKEFKEEGAYDDALYYAEHILEDVSKLQKAVNHIEKQKSWLQGKGFEEELDYRVNEQLDEADIKHISYEKGGNVQNRSHNIYDDVLALKRSFSIFEVQSPQLYGELSKKFNIPKLEEILGNMIKFFDSPPVKWKEIEGFAKGGKIDKYVDEVFNSLELRDPSGTRDRNKMIEWSRLQKKWDNYRKDAGSQSVMIDDMPDEAREKLHKQFLKEVREEMKKEGYGIGGVLGGALVGGYVGYKIGRSAPQKTGFDTEKELYKNVKKGFKRNNPSRYGNVQDVDYTEVKYAKGGLIDDTIHPYILMQKVGKKLKPIKGLTEYEDRKITDKMLEENNQQVSGNWNYDIYKDPNYFAKGGSLIEGMTEKERKEWEKFLAPTHNKEKFMKKHFPKKKKGKKKGYAKGGRLKKGGFPFTLEVWKTKSRYEKGNANIDIEVNTFDEGRELAEKHIKEGNHKAQVITPEGDLYEFDKKGMKKYAKGGEISREKLLKMDGEEIMDYHWKMQTQMYNSLNNKDLSRVYRHWFADEGYDREDLENVDRDEMIWDLIEDEKRYKKDWKYTETKEDKEEVIDELFYFDDYAKGGKVWGNPQGGLNIYELRFSKIDYDVDVSPDDLEVAVNIKGSDSVNHNDLNDSKADWSQESWGYMIYPKTIEQLYDVLKVLKLKVSKKRLEKYFSNKKKHESEVNDYIKLYNSRIERALKDMGKNEEGYSDTHQFIGEKGGFTPEELAGYYLDKYGDVLALSYLEQDRKYNLGKTMRGKTNMNRVKEILESKNYAKGGIPYSKRFFDIVEYSKDGTIVRKIENKNTYEAEDIAFKLNNTNPVRSGYHYVKMEERFAKGGETEDENSDLISGNEALDLYASEEIFTAEQDLRIDQAIDGQDLETDEIRHDFREWTLYNQKDWFEEDEEISGNDRALEVLRDFDEFYDNGLTHRQNWTAFLEYAQDALPKYRKGGVILYKDPNDSYTIVIDDSVFDMNEHRLNYDINTYIGERSEFPEDVSHWGKKINLKDAPIVIRDKVKERQNTSFEKGGTTNTPYNYAPEWNNITENKRKDILSLNSCSPKYSSYSYKLLNPDTKEQINIYFETNKDKLGLSKEERETQIRMLEQALIELGGKDIEIEGEIKKLKSI